MPQWTGNFQPVQQPAPVSFNPVPPHVTVAQQPQQFQQFQQPQQLQQQQQPDTQSTVGSVSLVSHSVGAGADAHTRFLGTIMKSEKAFRVPCKINVGGHITELPRHQTQADQGSDMNIVSTGLVKQLGLELHPLSDVGFYGLTMQTADNNETLLHHWVWLNVGVQDVWRNIRCFVGPETVPGADHLSLLLGIPWLYAVNAFFDIRGSRILVGDPNTGEAQREVVGPELVFHTDHNLLMYPKAAFPILPQPVPGGSGDVTDSESDDESDSGDDLSDIQDPKDFQ